MRAALCILAAGLVLAGCGASSEQASAPGAAALVPAGVSAFVSIDADLDSAQWEQAKELLDKFPGKDRLLRELERALAKRQLDWERDVEPAVGDELVFASFAPGLDGDHVVGITKAQDVGKFRALAKKLDDGPSTVERIDGWVVFSNDAALVERLRKSRTSLADDPAFRKALRQLPDERLGVFFARGRALGGLVPILPSSGGRRPQVDWVAGAVEARDEGAAVRFVASGPAASSRAYASRHIADAPGNALVFASFSADLLRRQAAQLEPFSALLGIRIGDLLRELHGEGALWIRPGDDFVELTVVVDADNPSRAAATLSRLRDVLPTQLHAGVADGHLVVTTAHSVERALARRGAPLGKSEDFRAAIRAAGMPERTAGFLYVDVKGVVPFLLLAGAGGVDVPDDALQNLRPLQSVVAWAEPDGAQSRFELFAQIK
jgi:hypothetical protein